MKKARDVAHAVVWLAVMFNASVFLAALRLVSEFVEQLRSIVHACYSTTGIINMNRTAF